MRGGRGDQSDEFIWLMFCGLHEFHMSKQEIMRTRYGEMLDLIAVLSIYNGTARPKAAEKNRHITNYDEAVLVR